MKLRYITCSDPHEHVSYNDLINLSNISPLVEFGIQAHETQMSYHQPRNEWFNDILNKNKKETVPLNIALHINYQWCIDMCNGKTPDIIKKWISEKHNITHQNIIQRIQLNIGDGMYMEQLKPLTTANLIHNNPQYEFIFPYNNITKKFIEELHKTNANFSLLYDSSYGVGISPERWESPVYQNHNQGYAGGLSPDNIKDNLSKINSVLSQNYSTWIDAEGKLMYPYTRNFDINRAQKYISNALSFFQLKGKQK